MASSVETPESVALPLVATDEEVEIRAAVRGICESVGGPEYHRRIVEADESPRELWDALAEKGYLGVNLPWWTPIHRGWRSSSSRSR